MRGLKLPDGAAVLARTPRARAGDRCAAPVRLPLYVHTGFDEWYGWGYDLGDLERIAERHPEIPLVLCHCAFPRLDWAAAMARRHPQVWLDTTNVFGSIELAPEPARAGLLDKVADLFDAAPDRIFFGTDYPAAMGSLAELHGQIPPARAEQMAANAARFVNESFGLDLERGRSSKVH